MATKNNSTTNVPATSTKQQISEELRQVLALPIPTTTTRGGVLALSADLSRVEKIAVNGNTIHGANPVKVHPKLSNIYKVLALAAVMNPRSDRGSSLVSWVASNAEVLKNLKDRNITIVSSGTEVTASVEDIINYCVSSTKIKVKFNTVLRVRKEKEESTEEYEFI